VTERNKCREVAQIGRICILVNNAGINRRNAFTADAEAVIKDWQDVLAVNLNGVFNVTHAFLGQLRATKGRIVNIGSVQSFVHVRTPNSPRTPPRSTRCSVSPARWRPSSVMMECESTPSAPA
jgi:NAD(P)-dependent dehydrogenase (short-subunit alcohol dehydrogenase family)